MEAVGQKVPRQLMQLATSYGRKNMNYSFFDTFYILFFLHCFILVEPFRRAKLIGRSFSSHMKLNKAKKNGELHPVGPSSAGLG